MTNDDILSMAKKSGIVTERNTEHLTVDGLERFAALIAAAEREVCAAFVQRLPKSSKHLVVD